jgi:hypothetical protein
MRIETTSRIFAATLQHRLEDVYGSGGIDPHILNLNTRWRWLFSFKTRKQSPTAGLGAFSLSGTQNPVP